MKTIDYAWHDPDDDKADLLKFLEQHDELVDPEVTDFVRKVLAEEPVDIETIKARHRSDLAQIFAVYPEFLPKALAPFVLEPAA